MRRRVTEKVTEEVPADTPRRAVCQHSRGPSRGRRHPRVLASSIRTRCAGPPSSWARGAPFWGPGWRKKPDLWLNSPSIPPQAVSGSGDSWDRGCRVTLRPRAAGGSSLLPPGCSGVWARELRRPTALFSGPVAGSCSGLAPSPQRGCPEVCRGLGGPRSELSDGSSFSPLPVASEAFEDDNCSAFVSEDDSETQSLSSFSSGPTSPSETPEQFPAAVRPASLDLPSPVSLSEFGVLFPGLGPRSECSGASSPECEVERGECSPRPRGGGGRGPQPGCCDQGLCGRATVWLLTSFGLSPQQSS